MPDIPDTILTLLRNRQEADGFLLHFAVCKPIRYSCYIVWILVMPIKPQLQYVQGHRSSDVTSGYAKHPGDGSGGWECGLQNHGMTIASGMLLLENIAI